MSEKVELDYFYGVQAEQFTFYRIPKILVTDSRFKGVSSDAKILYGVLLDRMSLSMKSGWLDKQNRVFIIFTIKEICEKLGCSKDKAMNMISELDTSKGIGLIEKVKRGLGLPDIIYVKNFATLDAQTFKEKKVDKAVNPVKKQPAGKQRTYGEISAKRHYEVGNNKPQEVAYVRYPEVDDSRHPEVAENQLPEVAKKQLPEVAKMPPQEVAETPPQRWQKTDPNNNYINNNKYNNLFSSLPLQGEENGNEWNGGDASANIIKTLALKEKYVEYLKKQVEYNDLMQMDGYREKKKIIDGIINEIADIATTTPPDNIEWVNGRQYDHEVVKSHMLKIDYDSMIQILDNLAKNTTKITKKRAYLITAIYNGINLHDFEFEMDFQNSYYGAWRQNGGDE